MAEVKVKDPEVWGGPRVEPRSSPKLESLPHSGMAHQDVTGGSERGSDLPKVTQPALLVHQDATQESCLNAACVPPWTLPK